MEALSSLIAAVGVLYTAFEANENAQVLGEELMGTVNLIRDYFSENTFSERHIKSAQTHLEKLYSLTQEATQLVYQMNNSGCLCFGRNAHITEARRLNDQLHRGFFVELKSVWVMIDEAETFTKVWNMLFVGKNVEELSEVSAGLESHYRVPDQSVRNLFISAGLVQEGMISVNKIRNHFGSDDAVVAAIQSGICLGRTTGVINQYELPNAVARGAIARVRHLLDRGALPNSRDVDGTVALAIAAQRGRVELCRLLLEHGAIVHDDFQDPLALAAAYGHSAVIECLVANGASVDYLNSSGMTALHVAAKAGQHAAVQSLLRLKACVCCADVDGNTPAELARYAGHIDIAELLTQHEMGVIAVTASETENELLTAVADGNVELVRRYLALDVSVNCRNEEFRTPLLLAAINGNSEMIRSLLAHKPIIDAVDSLNYSALHWAIVHVHTEVVGLLLSAGADIRMAIPEGFGPLSLAVRSGSLEIVTLLLSAGCDPNADAGGPIFCAIRENESNIIQLLVDHGASLTSTTLEGAPPLVVAVQEKRVEMIPLLLALGAQVDQADQLLMTPLMHAADLQQPRAIRTLLKANPDISLKNDEGKTVFELPELGSPCAKLLTRYETILNPQLIVEAAASGDCDRLHELIDNCAMLGWCDIDGRDGLIHAVINRHVDCVKLLLTHGASVTLIDDDGACALDYSINLGFSEISELLMKAGGRQTQNSLSVAVATDKPDIVLQLLESGLDLNAFDSQNRSALMMVPEKSIEMVDFLVQKGADLNLCNSDGLFPLTKAILENHKRVALKMLELGARPSHDFNGQPLTSLTDDEELIAALNYYTKLSSPISLAHAVSTADIAKVQLLLGRGQNVNVTFEAAHCFEDEQAQWIGMTPLLLAIIANNSDLVSFLLSNGADPNFSPTDLSPLSYSIATGEMEIAIVEALLEAGADPNHIAPDSTSALRLALFMQWHQAIEKLLDFGADLMIPIGDPILFSAFEINDSTIFELILSHLQTSDLSFSNSEGKTLQSLIDSSSPTVQQLFSSLSQTR